jgi:hypothetical protein
LSVQWGGGNGQKRILTVKDGGFTAPTAVLNGQDYVSNAQFDGLSSKIDGSSVVFDDLGNNVSIFGLNPNTTYYLSIFEYNTNCGSPTYLTSSVATHIVTTLQNTVWNGTSWTNGTPDNTKEAVIDGIYDTGVNGDFTAKYMIVNAGATIYIQNGSSVTIDLDVENNGTINQCASGTYTVGGTSSGTGVHNTTYPFDPTVESSNQTLSKLTSGVVEFDWTVGNGDKRMVIVKANSAIDVNAISDGTTYTADDDMLGAGDLIDGGVVVFNGNGNMVTVINLVANTTYHYAIIEYNEACGTNNYATTSPLTGTFTMSDIPYAPTNLRANAINSSAIYLSWNDTNAFETNYYVEKSDFNNTNFVQIAILNPDVTSYTVSGLEPNETYYFRVRAAEFINYSNYSNEAFATTSITSPTLSNISNIGNNSFFVDWNTITEAEGYEIDISTESNFSSFISGYQSFALSAANTSLTVNNLSGNLYYYVRVRATIGNLKSPNSNVVSALTVPDAMTILSASNITQTGFRANWNFQNNSTGYELEVATDEAFTQILSNYNPFSTTLNYKDVSELEAGTMYYYRVRVSNVSGMSANSNVIPVVTLPESPLNNEVTNSTNSGFTASWSAVNNATAYELEISLSNDFSSLIAGYNPLELSSNSQEITNLEAGTTYYSRVRAKNANGESDNSNIITALTIADAPVPVSPSNSDITQNAFTISWEAVEGAENYELFVANDRLFENPITGYNGFETTATSKIVEGLEAGTWYYFKVKTLNASGESAFSALDSVITKPATPEITSADNLTNTSFDLFWAETKGAELGYWLDVASNESFTTYVSGFNKKETNNLTENINFLNAGTIYYARIRALNESGASPVSETFTILTLPDAPETEEATLIKTTSFTSNWTSVTSATSYLLEVATDENFTNYLTGFEGMEVSTTSLAIENAEVGTTYFYRVRAQNESGISEYSNVSQAITFANSPELESISNVTINSFEVQWKSVFAATSYLIDVALDNSFVNILSNYNNVETTALNFNIEGLDAGTNYYVRVKAKSEAGLSDYSNVLSALTLPTIPIFSGNTPQVDKVLVVWGIVQSANAYLMDVYLDETFTNVLENYNAVEVSNSSVTITGLVAYTNYYVRVKAKNATGLSDYSATLTIKTKPQTVVLSEATEVSNNAFSFSWEASNVAVSYNIQVSTNSQFSSTIVNENVSETSYTATNLNPNTTYYSRVKVLTNDYESAYSNVINTITAPLAPTLIFQNSTENTVSFRWGIVNAAKEYALDIATDEGFTNMLADYQDKRLTNSSFTATDLTPMTTYYVRMRSVGTKGVSENSVSLKVMTIPLAPEIQSPTNFTNNSFDINWVSSSIGNFSIEVSTNENFTTKLQNWNGKVVSGNSITINELNAGTNYFVRIKSLAVENVVLASNYSNVINTITVPSAPVALSASKQNSDSFVANWQTVQGATQYELTVATDANMVTILATYPILTSELSYEVGNLNSLSNYFYQIKALNASGISEGSTIISTKTASNAPIDLNITNISSTSFQLNWAIVDVSENFEIEVSLNESFVPITFKGETTETSLVIQNLTEGNRYFCRVKSLVTDGNTTLISSPSSVASVYLPKTPTGITFNNITNVGFTLNWNADNNASAYQVDISEKEDFSTFVEGYQSTTLITNNFTANDLLGNVTYYVRLRSVASGAASNNSVVRSQMTLPPLPDIARLKRISERRVTKIEWFYSAGFRQSLNNLTFSLERSDNEGEPYQKITTQDIPYNALGIVYEDFTAQTRLRATYKLIIKNGVGESALEFEQRIITANEDEWSEENWTLYPVPAGEFIYLKMPSGVNQATLILMDIQGKEILTQEAQSLNGESVKINTATLPKGTYLLEIRHKNYLINKRFVR